jgi:Mrp family chromosome partitioning ATPase
MRAAERLPIILSSLSTVYDVIVIECGPTNAAAIKKLIGDGGVVMVSVLDPTDTVIADR